MLINERKMGSLLDENKKLTKIILMELTNNIELIKTKSKNKKQLTQITNRLVSYKKERNYLLNKFGEFPPIKLTAPFLIEQENIIQTVVYTRIFEEFTKEYSNLNKLNSAINQLKKIRRELTTLLYINWYYADL